MRGKARLFISNLHMKELGFIMFAARFIAHPFLVYEYSDGRVNGGSECHGRGKKIGAAHYQSVQIIGAPIPTHNNDRVHFQTP